ncbi:MAG: class I SAM-dependent methyltransferase [Acidimicrobiales bacterium]
MHEHHQPTHSGGHLHAFESPEMAQFAELEGEVLSGFVSQAGTVLAQRNETDDRPARRVLDLGCGPGVGTCILAEHLAEASVIAVDGSAAMVERAAARTERLGLTSRVTTRLVALPDDLDSLVELGRHDVVWASMVLHHLGDEIDALRRIRPLLEPDGLLAIVEMGGPLRVLPGDAAVGRPGFEDRLDAAWEVWFAEMRSSLPGSVASTDYPTMLERAGFEVVVDEMLTLELDAPLDDRARRFAHRHLERSRARLGNDATTADRETFDVLLGDSSRSVLGGDGVAIRASRHLYVARAA